MGRRTIRLPNGLRMPRIAKHLFRIAGHELREVGDEIIERRNTQDELVRGLDGSFGICLHCWPAREGKEVPLRARREPRRWTKQEINCSLPWLPVQPGCGQCNHKYIEDMIQCPGCEMRLAAQTDFSIIAEPDRLRRSTAREGRQVNIIDLQPSSWLSRHRVIGRG